MSIPKHLHGDQEIHGEFPHTLKIHHLTGHVPAHVHNFIEYTYAFQGRATEIINGIERPLLPGTFTLLFPHQVHEIRFAPGEEVFLYIGAIGLQAFFDRTDTLLSLQRLLRDAENDWNTSYALEGEAASDMLALLKRMHEELLGGQAWHQVLYVSKLFEVFVRLDRHRLAAGMRNRPAGSASPRPTGMWDVIKHVYQHYREPISLRSLADRFGFAVPYISAAFKELTGENYSRFLERIRLAHARNLLLGSKMKVADVCYEVGFSSYPTFARVFLARTGMSPTDFRKAGGLPTDR
ncbi:AraC family transcriptional regulator [Cohnella sp. GCM10027633]|uniref:helix-turn-helix transcriptional regulator n=1 Tax=unclassified Cohnella TaxID=2636738 RepID=UPI003630F4EF